MFDEFGFIDAFGGGGADISPIMFDTGSIADTAWTPSLDSSMFSPDMAMGGAGGFDQVGPIVNALADAGRFDLIPPVLEAAGLDMNGGIDPLTPLAESPSEVSPAMPEAAPLDTPSLTQLMTQPAEAPAFLAPPQMQGAEAGPQYTPTPLVINPEQQFSAEALTGYERGIQPPQTLGLGAASAFELGSQPPMSGAQSFDEGGFSLSPFQHNDGGPMGSQGAPDVGTSPDFSWVFGGQPDIPADTFADRFGALQQSSPASVIADHFKNYQQSGAQSFDEGGFNQQPFVHNDGAPPGSQMAGLSDGPPATFGQPQAPPTLQGYGANTKQDVPPRPPEEMLPGSTPQVRSFVQQAYEKFPGIRLTSAARTPATNVGGARGSQHLSGNATDWNMSRLAPEQRQQFVQWARTQGAGGIGTYDAQANSVHVDFRTNAKHAWGPNYSHTSLGQTPQWFQQEAAAHRAGRAPAYAPTDQKPEAVKAIDSAVKDKGPEITKADLKPAPGYTVPKAEVKQFIHAEATMRGIDPKLAMKVAKHEGLDQWQSTVVKDGKRENSFGPFQLYTGGGLGNEFQKATGLDPKDPANWQESTRFALDHIAKNGWGAFYGAKAAGITGKMGIGEGFTKEAGGPPLEPTTLPQGATPTEGRVRVADAGQRTMTDMPAIFGGLFGGGQGGGGMPAILGGGGGRNPFNDPGSLAAMELIVNSLSRAAPISGLAESARHDQRYAEQQMGRQAAEAALIQMGYSPQEARAYSYNPAAVEMLQKHRQQQSDQSAYQQFSTDVLGGGQAPRTQPAPQQSPSMLSPAPMAQTPSIGQPQQQGAPAIEGAPPLPASTRTMGPSPQKILEFINKNGSRLSPEARKMYMGLYEKSLEAYKPTGTQSDYRAYYEQEMAGGRAPLTFRDWDMQNRGAGASKVTVNTGEQGDVAFDKEFGKANAERYGEYIKQGDVAKGRMSDIGILRDASRNLGSQGVAANVKATFGPYLEAAGVDINGLSDIQTWESVTKRIAPTMRVAGSGSTSDIEYKGMLQAVGPLSNNPAAREAILDTFEAGSRNEIERGRIASMLATKEITRKEAEEMIRALPDPMTAFREWRKDNSDVYSEAVKHGKATPEAKSGGKKGEPAPSGPPKNFDKMPVNDQLNWLQRNAPEGTEFTIKETGNKYIIIRDGKAVPVKKDNK